MYVLIVYNTHVLNYKENLFEARYILDSMTYLYINYSVMVTENCKKIEPVVVKLCSKTNIPLFSEHGVRIPQLHSCLHENILG